MLDEMQAAVEGLRALCMRVAMLNETYQRKRMQLMFLVEEERQSTPPSRRK